MSRQDKPFYASEIDQLLDAAEQIRASASGGQFIILSSSDSQFGKTRIIDTLADGLKDAGWNVVQRYARDGGPFAPSNQTLRKAKWAAQSGKIAGAATGLAEPVTGGIIGLISEIATAAHMAASERQYSTKASNPIIQISSLADTIEAAANDGPIALLFDDADKLSEPEAWWDVFFGTLMPRLISIYPILCIVSVDGSTGAKGSRARETIDIKLLATDAVKQIILPPLSRRKISIALGGVEDSLLNELVALSQGRPAWLDDIMRRWESQSIIVKYDDRWQFAPDGYANARKTMQNWVEASLHAAVSPDRYALALNLVRTASLEGMRFTAEAIAELHEFDVEDLIDWIDQNLALPADPEQSVLLDEGFVERAEGLDPPELRLYKFRSPLASGSLRQGTLASPNGKALAGRYARVLSELYRWSPPHYSAWSIARLAEIAGDAALVETTWRRANRIGSIHSAVQLGRFLVDQLNKDSLLIAELRYSVARLNEVNSILRGAWDAEETFSICQVAERAARRLRELDPSIWCKTDLDSKILLINALVWSGLAALGVERWDDGTFLFREAERLASSTPDRFLAANLLRIYGMSIVRSHPSPVPIDTAVEGFTRAIKALRDEHETSAIALRATLHANLADALRIKMAAGGQQAEQLVEAARTFQQIDLDVPRKPDIADSIEAIFYSAGEFALARKDHSQAEKFMVAALDCSRSPIDQVAHLLSLSNTLLALNRSTDAAFRAAQALRLGQELGPWFEFMALAGLAKAAESLDKLPAKAVIVVLARNRHSPAGQPGKDSGPYDAETNDLNEAARYEIESLYRRDKGAGLLHSTFDIRTQDIDEQNELLGLADPWTIRGIFAEIERYCSDSSAGQ